jgi:toxin YoeB
MVTRIKESIAEAERGEVKRISTPEEIKRAIRSMSYVIDFTKSALEDLEKHKKSGDLKILRKIAVLLTELLIHPQTGTGHPELLKNEIKETYSRRINKKA